MVADDGSTSDMTSATDMIAGGEGDGNSPTDCRSGISNPSLNGIQSLPLPLAHIRPIRPTTLDFTQIREDKAIPIAFIICEFPEAKTITERPPDGTKHKSKRYSITRVGQEITGEGNEGYCPRKAFYMKGVPALQSKCAFGHLGQKSRRNGSKTIPGCNKLGNVQAVVVQDQQEKDRISQRNNCQGDSCLPTIKVNSWENINMDSGSMKFCTEGLELQDCRGCCGKGSSPDSENLSSIDSNQQNMPTEEYDQIRNDHDSQGASGLSTKTEHGQAVPGEEKNMSRTRVSFCTESLGIPDCRSFNSEESSPNKNYLPGSDSNWQNMSNDEYEDSYVDEFKPYLNSLVCFVVMVVMMAGGIAIMFSFLKILEDRHGTSRKFSSNSKHMEVDVPSLVGSVRLFDERVLPARKLESYAPHLVFKTYNDSLPSRLIDYN